MVKYNGILRLKISSVVKMRVIKLVAKLSVFQGIYSLS